MPSSLELERPEDLLHVREPGGLDVAQVDGVVHVPEPVEVAERDVLGEGVAEPLHGGHGSFAPPCRSPESRPARRSLPSQNGFGASRSVSATRRYPEGLVLFTGCGTSFHAAQVGAGLAEGRQSRRSSSSCGRRRADVLVAVSHEGTTPLTTEAVRAFDGPSWLLTGTAESPLAKLATTSSKWHPRSRSRTATPRATRPPSQRWPPWRVTTSPGFRLPSRPRSRDRGSSPSDHDRWLIVGAGRDWPTAQEAVLKLREGTFVAAEAYHIEQLLHGHLAAVDETVRALVLDGEGRAGERSRDAVKALREIGAAAELLPQADGAAERPILGILPFHLLVLDLAERRGVNPDRIRQDEEPWKRARDSYE